MHQIKELQKDILSIAQFFHDFCQKNELSYFLLGGSALGAARHKGFIPWDDDFDVCMPFPDYQRLIELAPQFEGSGFCFEKENTQSLPLFFSKLRKEGTCFIEHESEFEKSRFQGVYIDIMCLSPGYDFIALRYIQYLAAKVLNTHALAKRGWYETTSLHKQAALVTIPKLINEKLVLKLLDWIRIPRFFKTGKYQNHFFGRAPFKKACILQSVIGQGSFVEFETTEFIAFSSLDEYLKGRFGERYMDPPSQAIRDQFPSHCIHYSGSKSEEPLKNE